jgi:hypothetical protein
MVNFSFAKSLVIAPVLVSALILFAASEELAPHRLRHS